MATWTCELDTGFICAGRAPAPAAP